MTGREQLVKHGSDFAAARAAFGTFVSALPGALEDVPTLAFDEAGDGTAGFAFAGRYYTLAHLPPAGQSAGSVIDLQSADAPKSLPSPVRSAVLMPDGRVRADAESPPRWALPDDAADLFVFHMTGH